MNSIDRFKQLISEDDAEIRLFRRIMGMMLTHPLMPRCPPPDGVCPVGVSWTRSGLYKAELWPRYGDVAFMVSDLRGLHWEVRVKRIDAAYDGPCLEAVNQFMQKLFAVSTEAQ